MSAFQLPAGYGKRPRKLGVKRNHPEQSLQTAVAAYLGWSLSPRSFFTAIGHGGGGRLRGAILKGMGLKAGVPDILIIHGGRCCFLELKAKAGSLSAEQRLVHAVIVSAGASVAVARSLEDVKAALDVWGIPTRTEKPSATLFREAADRQAVDRQP
jgi:hypothetical protein